MKRKVLSKKKRGRKDFLFFKFMIITNSDFGFP